MGKKVESTKVALCRLLCLLELTAQRSLQNHSNCIFCMALHLPTKKVKFVVPFLWPNWTHINFPTRLTCVVSIFPQFSNAGEGNQKGIIPDRSLGGGWNLGVVLSCLLYNFHLVFKPTPQRTRKRVQELTKMNTQFDLHTVWIEVRDQTKAFPLADSHWLT